MFSEVMAKPELIHRSCAFCKKQLQGRNDKRFCDYSCRNNYNNLLKRAGNKCIRNINNALTKNRRILKELLKEGGETTKATEDRLKYLGFQFNYFTNTYTTKNERTYYFCYDYGYLPLENSWYLVVKKNTG